MSENGVCVRERVWMNFFVFFLNPVFSWLMVNNTI